MYWTWPDIPNKRDWAVLAVFGLVTAIWGAAAGFNFPAMALTALMNSMIMLACAGYLKARGVVPFFSALFGALSWVLAAATIMSHASYVWASAGFPIMDPVLARIDATLGIDKEGIMAITGSSWWLSQASLIAYHKTAYEMFLGFAVLMAMGNYKRVADTFSVLTVCMVMTLVLSSLAPAVGAFVALKPTAALMGYLNDPIIGVWHLDHLMGLRDGSFRTFPTTEWQGIVTFPSFHTLYALTAGYALATTRYLAWPAALFSGFVVFTTMPVGGHYFFDLLTSFSIFAFAVFTVDAEGQERVRSWLNPVRSRRLAAGMA